MSWGQRLQRSFKQMLWQPLLIGLLIVQCLGLLGWGLLWPKPPPVELSFIAPESEKIPWEAVISNFENSHPHIQIHLVTDPEIQTTDQREAIYRADFQSENARYDLVYMDSVWTAQFADQLVDLTPKLQQASHSLLDGFLDSELEVGTYQQRLYRLPMRSDVGVLYYRQDLLNQAGVELPQNSAIAFSELESLIRTVQASTDIGMGYIWQGESYEGLVANFVETASSFGGDWIRNTDKKVFPELTPILQATKILQDLIQSGLSPLSVTDYKELDALEVFQQGNAIFLRGWPYFWSELKATELGDKVAIAPPFSFSSNPGVGCRGGWGFGIPKKGVHPDEAWEAIQYFTSAEAQKIFVLASGFLPSRRSLFTDPDIVAQYPLMPQMLEYLEHSSVFRPQLLHYNSASKILQTALERSLISNDPNIVDQEMRKAQLETEELLKTSGV